MKIFAIGDTHLSLDPRIDKPMDIFGKGWENHVEKLNKAWHDMVTDEDYVLVAGDISWGLRLDEAMADLDFIHGLPGTKLIFKGNHDLWWQSISKLNAIYAREEDGVLIEDPGIHFMQYECYTIPGTKIGICGTRGWICPGTDGFSLHDRAIYERELIRLRFSLDDAVRKGMEEIIAVLHYPPTNDKKQPSGFTDMLSEYNVKQCVYGHLHNPEVHKHGFQGILNGVKYNLVSLDYLNCMLKEIEI